MSEEDTDAGRHVEESRSSVSELVFVSFSDVGVCSPETRAAAAKFLSMTGKKNKDDRNFSLTERFVLFLEMLNRNVGGNLRC